MAPRRAAANQRRLRTRQVASRSRLSCHCALVAGWDLNPGQINWRALKGCGDVCENEPIVGSLQTSFDPAP
jgi:hypothetical protein